jgi:high-affinity Fe2+/Pb2+ permease
LFNVVAAILVYQDARQNSSQSAALWGLVVFFAGFILGTLLYVLLGRDRRGSSVTAPQ